jgi:uncharacterized protein YkwD
MSRLQDSLRPALRALAVALAMTLSVVGLTALGTSPSVAGPSSLSSGTYEHRVQKWINHERAKRGLSHLRVQRCTDHSAEEWARHLARRDAFYHQSMGRLLNRCDAYYAGETLGRGSIWPSRLVRMWMNSPPHRAVLLSPHAKRIGIGAVKDSHGQWLTAANFTQMF